MDEQKLKNIIEAALLAAGKPVDLEQLQNLFEEAARPSKADITSALAALEQDCAGRGIELKKVASGYRLQVRAEFSPWVSRLWEEKPARYSRAFLETLALVAYRQPLTRGEIESVRGVAVSANIIRTMLDHGWIKVVGHRDVPGKPELFGTTKQFLDAFNLQTLENLPSLAEIRQMEDLVRDSKAVEANPELLQIKLQLEENSENQNSNEAPRRDEADLIGVLQEGAAPSEIRENLEEGTAPSEITNQDDMQKEDGQQMPQKLNSTSTPLYENG